MSSTFENTLFDFDLDFLNQPATSDVEHDQQARAAKLRRQVCKIKKKVKWVDENVESIIVANKIVDEFRVREIQLQAQCKQQLVEIGTFIEKITGLENAICAAETRERQKNEKICELENQIAALKVLQTQMKALQFEKNNTKNELVETRRKDKTKISNLNKEHEKLRKEIARIPSLEKEIVRLRKDNTLVPKEKLIENNDTAKIQKLEKEIEILCKENTKISKLEKEIETLNTKNAESVKLEEEIEILRKENTKIPKLEKEIETLNKINAESLKLDKEIEILRKENTKISKLEKAIETLNKKNAESLKMEKEIENLQKENAKIPNMAKEIEHLRKENAKIMRLGNENENLFKQNSNLEKDIETLRIKNAKMEMENKAFIKEIDKIRNEEKNIETRLTHLTSTTKENDKLLQKKNKLTRKYKSLPDRNSEWCDKNYLFEDPLLSPAPHDTTVAKKSPIVDKDIEMLREPDYDNSNEVASEDTGRGSSLANSDTDKSLHSPEYFLNYSHPTGEKIKNKTKAKDASMLRGSILLEEIDDTTIEHDKIQNICKPKTVSQTNAASEVSVNVDSFHNSINCTLGEQDKGCLEMNNSLQCDSHTNLELLHIFSTMRLHYKAMSPIPRTPIKMHEMDSTFSPSNLSEKISRCSLLCKETAVFLIQLEMRLGSSNHSFTINYCDRLIACLDSVLKSEQTLNEDSIPFSTPNMQLSNCVLSHDDNSLVSIPESTISSSENEPELLHNKKSEKRLTQNRMLRDVNNPVIISSPLSPDMETNIFTHKQAENGLSMDRNQIFNHPVTQELAMSNEISEVTESVRYEDQSPLQNIVGKKSKSKKVTKLGKLKKKLEPKYKIKMDKTPPRNLRMKPKQLIDIKKNVAVNETSASLNNKDAYEKAVKVMAELNSQQGTKTKSLATQTKVLMSPKRSTCLEVNQTSASLNGKDTYEKAVKVMGELNCQEGAKTKSSHKQTTALMSRRLTTNLEKDINNSSENQFLRKCSMTCRSKRNLSDLFDTCSVLLIKDPLLLSPLKSQNSTTHKLEDDDNSTTHRSLEDNNVTTLRAKEVEYFSTHRVKDREDEENNSTTDVAKQDSNISSDRVNEHNIFTTNSAKEDFNSTTDRVNEDLDCTTNRLKEDGNSTTDRVHEDNDSKKEYSNSTTDRVNVDNNFTTNRAKEDSNSTTDRVHEDNDSKKEYSNCTTDRVNVDNNFTTNRAKEDSNSTTDKVNVDNDSTTNRAKEDNNSTKDGVNEDNNSTTNTVKEDSNSTTDRVKEDNDYTSNRSKQGNASNKAAYKAGNSSMNHKEEEDKSFTNHNATDNSNTCDELPSRKRRRRSSNEPLTQSKMDECFTTHNATEDIETCDELPSRKGRRCSSNEPLIQSKKAECFTTHNASEDTETCDELPIRKGRRRSSNEPLIQSKKDECFTTHNSTEDTEACDELLSRKGRRRSSNEPLIQSKDECFTTHNATEDSKTCDELPSRKRQRRSSNEPLIQYKRVLRSATINTGLCMEDKMELTKTKDKSNRKSRIGPIANEDGTQLNNVNTNESLQFNQRDNNVVSYGDSDMFSEDIQPEKKISAPVRELNMEASACHPKESILCYMLEKHGVETVRPHQKKIPENTVKQICEKLEQNITIITETKDNKNAMNNFVDDLRKLHYKHFIAGLMMFLAKPERKTELFGKVNSHPAPPMTKTEQVLLYAIHQLGTHWPSVDIVDAVLSSIEFTLFKLNRTPDFGVIESTSHFYAILCRYVKAKSRLRLFMLDAMYCIQFKSVPLIKQCLEVWMHTIPLSHLGMAKTPLVTCLVYLLHFYRCEDKFNRVQEIRKILRDKYYYQITDWNEAKILEMFKNSIKDLKDIAIEKKMLRLALIILGKRQGPQWCQNNIVKSLLQPMIEKKNVPNHAKEFCVSMIGPLMKPYPVDMKVHCEIAINQLVDILNKNPSPEMEEAAMTSMMYINRHDQRSINKTLLSRKMKPMSLALEKSIRDYVKTKPLKIWKKNLTTMAR